jgi:4-amino-4-deoxy-L-arabinose transferase-like glycosyltransferase
MGKKTRIGLLIGILIIAIFLRFYHLTTTPPGLYPDEAMDGNNAAEVAATGHYQVFYPEDNGREGLYVNIIAVMLKYFNAPHEPWVIRLPAAVAGVLTVLGLYLLVAELLGYETGLLAAFLLATCFWHINFSRIGFRAILSPLLLTWSLYLLIKAFRAASRRAGAWYAIAAGVVYGLGFYTYIAYRVTPLLFLLFIPFFKKEADFWKRVLVFLIVTFIVAAPIGWYFVKNPDAFFGRTTEISVTNNANPVREFAINLGKTALMFNFHGDENWRQNVSGAPELFWPVGILFLVGILLCLYAIWRRWRKRPTDRNEDILPLFSVLLVCFWIILGALPAAASDEGIPHALRSILMLPPAMIFAAIGGMWVYGLIKKHAGKLIAMSIAIVFIAGVAVYGYVDYFIIWAQNPNVPGAFNADYVAIGQEMNALPATTPKYVVVNAGGVLARGIPVPAETTMFITNSFTTSTQEAQNIHYLLPDETSSIPEGTPASEIFYID